MIARARRATTSGLNIREPFRINLSTAGPGGDSPCSWQSCFTCGIPSKAGHCRPRCTSSCRSGTWRTSCAMRCGRRSSARPFSPPTQRSADTPYYYPYMMVALLLYGYSCGLYSSRQLARACEERVDVMAVTGPNQSDFRTIADSSAAPLHRTRVAGRRWRRRLERQRVPTRPRCWASS